jgi:sirohydrochlorin cobaltochelatase
MTPTSEQQHALEELDFRLRIVLPEEYQDSYEEMQPTAMGSAGLKYAGDGTVAWNEIWGSFCDLAMAGGPPHKGTLLEPATPAEIAARPDRHQEVVDEICRGITMVTDLPARESPTPGWIRTTCFSDPMAGWLLRAIVTENVAVRAEGMALDLPVSPAFRLDKEIKNVITVIAKTCHYWMGHMPRAQRIAIAKLFADLASDTPLVQPAFSIDGVRPDADAPLYAGVAERIHRDTGLRASPHQYAGWLGLECADVNTAVWMMRALVVNNVLSRREGVVLFVPVNPAFDPNGGRVTQTVVQLHRLAAVRDLR